MSQTFTQNNKFFNNWKTNISLNLQIIKTNRKYIFIFFNFQSNDCQTNVYSNEVLLKWIELYYKLLFNYKNISYFLYNLQQNCKEQELKSQSYLTEQLECNTCNLTFLNTNFHSQHKKIQYLKVIYWQGVTKLDKFISDKVKSRLSLWFCASRGRPGQCVCWWVSTVDILDQFLNLRAGKNNNLGHTIIV